VKYLEAFFMSLGMFSSIPCPYRPWNEKARTLMVVFLPLVGLLIGILWFALSLLLLYLPLPLQLEAAVLMLYPFLITGFLHLDGFMDTNDALLSRRPLEEKLRILKDPHTGAFAVISLGILFVVSYAAMWGAVENLQLRVLEGSRVSTLESLIFIPMISRCCSAFFVLCTKPLGHSQYYREENHSKNQKECFAVIVTAVACLGMGALSGMSANSFSFENLIILTSIIPAYLIAIVPAMKELGGVSGDLAGYALTIAEAWGIAAISILTL
jgi:adenosylcobinamide-GDP ribazoletransferase